MLLPPSRTSVAAGPAATGPAATGPAATGPAAAGQAELLPTCLTRRLGCGDLAGLQL